MKWQLQSRIFYVGFVDQSADLIVCLEIPLATLSCVGFIDGTLNPTARPGQGLQEVVYNGKDRVHGLKWLAVALPDGLILYLFGPIEGRHHDSYLLALSGLLALLEQRFGAHPYCIFGDVAFPLSARLITPWRDSDIQYLHQQHFNRAHKAVRVAVEWSFRQIKARWPQLKRKDTQQILRSPLRPLYVVATLLSNAHTCLYGNQTSGYFNLKPVTLDQYFIV